MKKLLILGAALAMVALPMAAQDENPNYDRVTLGYQASIFVPDQGSNFTLNGMNIQYAHGIPLSQEHSFYLDLGLKLTWGYKQDKVQGINESALTSVCSTMNLVNLKLPINFSYKFNVADNVKLQPYLGINAGANIYFPLRVTERTLYTNGGQAFPLYGAAYPDGAYVKSKTDKGMMSDYGYRSFQMGCQVGCNVQINKWILGAEFGYDFIKVRKDINSLGVAVNAGYEF